MENENIKDIIEELLQERKFPKLRETLLEMMPIDIASVFDELSEDDLSKVFRLLPKELAAEVFACMDPDGQEHLISVFSSRELRAILDEMYVDDTVDLIEEMPANVVKRILAHTPQETRHQINEILKYPDDSAGSMMTIEYVDLRKDMTVSEAFDKIRRTGVDKETIYTCYVKDRNRHLLGVITVKKLLLSPSDAIIEDLMETNIICVDTYEDKEVVAKMFDKYDFLALPVVDKENRLVGIITVDDALDVIQEEATEDFERMAAILPSEGEYLKTSAFKHAKSRIFWLLLLMLTATFTGMIINRYESAFKSLPILVAFIPMIMGTGGNSGSQSATMVIRGLSLDEIRLSDFFKVLFKEAAVAILCGLVLAIVNGIRVYFTYDGDMYLAAVLGAALMATVLIAKVLGCLLPMGAKLLHLDPALMAGPLVTTITDTCSVLLYFIIASNIAPLFGVIL